jgi:hypothetical protein
MRRSGEKGEGERERERGRGREALLERLSERVEWKNERRGRKRVCVRKRNERD